MTTSNAKTTAIAASQPSLAVAQKALILSMLSTIILMMLTEYALAQQASAMGYALCSIVDIVYGNLGRGLAALGVIVVGVGAILGKTSWGLALTVATGIAVIFNAHLIVSALGVVNGAVCFGN